MKIAPAEARQIKRYSQSKYQEENSSAAAVEALKDDGLLLPGRSHHQVGFFPAEMLHDYAKRANAPLHKNPDGSLRLSNAPGVLALCILSRAAAACISPSPLAPSASAGLKRRGALNATEFTSRSETSSKD